MFSDVEGSTRLLERDWVALGRALARHHELLAGAVEDQGGSVFETVGDAVYAAFARPGPAVAARTGSRNGELRIGFAIAAGIHWLNAATGIGGVASASWR